MVTNPIYDGPMYDGSPICMRAYHSAKKDPVQLMRMLPQQQPQLTADHLATLDLTLPVAIPWQQQNCTRISFLHPSHSQDTKDIEGEEQATADPVS